MDPHARDNAGMARPIYLDHAATTPMRPEVFEAMHPFATDTFGNASGGHAVARSAKNALESARERVAAVLGCRPAEIVFTAGGTESDNLAIKGLAGHNGAHVVTTAIEHEAVSQAAHRCVDWGAQVEVVGVDARCRVDPDEVAEAVASNTVVVSVMYANNETGAIQPVRQVVEAVGGRVPVHTDAVQAFATCEVNVEELGVDLLSLSAHKFGGPKGVGLLYVRDGVGLAPILDGGGQELGRRSGTANVMGAVGMATAMELAVSERETLVPALEAIRHRFEQELTGVGERTIDTSAALASHAHLRIGGIRNETLLVRLDRAGVAASAGSSCASGAATVSPVLTAMGMTETSARECLRFSFGRGSTEDDAIRAAAIIRGAVA